MVYKNQNCKINDIHEIKKDGTLLMMCENGEIKRWKEG